jgi:hypothetical protein
MRRPIRFVKGRLENVVKTKIQADRLDAGRNLVTNLLRLGETRTRNNRESAVTDLKVSYRK